MTESEKTIARLLGKKIEEDKVVGELDEEQRELMKVFMEAKPEDLKRVMKVEEGVFEKSSMGLFPDEPFEGVHIHLISRGKWKGKGFNVTYARPGTTIKEGRNAHYYARSYQSASELGQLQQAYEAAKEWGVKRRDVDLFQLGPVRDEERERAKRMRDTWSRRESTARFLENGLQRIRGMSLEKKLEQCREAELELEDEKDEVRVTCEMFEELLRVAFGK